MVGISKGRLPVTHIAPKILMEMNYCERQLAQRLGLAAPAYHKRKVQPRILESASIACSITGNMMSAIGCGLGRGI